MAVTESREFPETAAPAEAQQPAGEIVNGTQVKTEPAPSEPIGSQPETDLDTLLKEYDAQVQPSPLGQEAAQPEQQTEPNELERLLADLDRQQGQPQVAAADPIAAERDQLKQQLADAQHRETVRRDLTDLEEVETALDRDVRGVFPDMPKGFVRMYLYAMAAAAPDAVRVFDERYQNPGMFRRLYKDMEKDIHRFMRDRPDRELTENKQLIAHAMRGASTNVMPEPSAPAFSRMSDRELRQWQEENLGSSQI
jgi:hypothetical protein